MSGDPDVLVSRVDAQKQLGIGHSKFYELVKRGRLPAVRLDGRTKVRQSDIDALKDGLPKLASIAPAARQ